MNKELIEKLREASYSASHGEMADLLQETADALEAKVATAGEREAFEAWIADKHDGVKHARGLDRVLSGERYVSMEVEWALRGFQAGAAYQRQSGVVTDAVRVLEPVTSEQYINSKHELLALMREFARLNGAGSHE